MPKFLSGLERSSCAASQSGEQTCSQAKSRRHSVWHPTIGTNSSSSKHRSSRAGRRATGSPLDPFERHTGVASRRGNSLRPLTCTGDLQAPQTSESDHSFSAREEGKICRVGRYGDMGQQTKGLTAQLLNSGGSKVTELPTGMWQPDDRWLCPIHRSRRISSGSTKPSTPVPRPHSREIVSRHRALKRSASGNNVPVGQGSDRGIRSEVALPRILQSAVLRSQDRRVTPPGIRLKIVEPVCPQGKF